MNETKLFIAMTIMNLFFVDKGDYLYKNHCYHCKQNITLLKFNLQKRKIVFFLF